MNISDGCTKESREEIERLSNLIIQDFLKVFNKIWEDLKVMWREIEEYMRVSPTKKLTYKPVLRLFPFSKRIRDKRLCIKYCRNNC